MAKRHQVIVASYCCVFAAAGACILAVGVFGRMLSIIHLQTGHCSCRVAQQIMHQTHVCMSIATLNGYTDSRGAVLHP